MSSNPAARTPKTPLVADFFQMAYVTNDLERAVERFQKVYGVEKFMLRQGTKIPRKTPQGIEAAELRVALAYVGHLELELIEAKHDNPARSLKIYSEVMPPDEFAVVHHHVAYHVHGDADDWRRFRASIDETEHPVPLEGDLDSIKWCYLDDRKLVGHYNEFIWHVNGDLHASIPQNYPVIG